MRRRRARNSARLRPLLVSPPIGQALSFDPLKGFCCALCVVYAKRGALVVTEIELGEVAAQMLLADMVIDAIDPALEDREIVLDGVGVRVASHVFLDTVVDALVARELIAHQAVLPGIVGHEPGAAIYLRHQDRAQRLGVHLGHVMRAHEAATLDQGERDLLARPADRAGALAAMLVLLLAADIGLVRLDRLAFAAKRASMKLAHPFADAVRHEPGALVGDPEHAVELVRADPLLARRHEMRREQPFVERNMARLVNRADRHSELLAAVVAVVKAGAMRALGALYRRDAVAHHAAMRAHGTIRPAHALKVAARLLGILKNGIGEIEVHAGILLPRMFLASI